MASIEPLSSLMTLQSQNYINNQQEKTNLDIEYQENSANIGQTNVVSGMTRTVQDASETSKNNDNNSSNKQFSEEDKNKIKDVVKEINKQLKNTSAEFSVHEETNRIQIKIIDKGTKKVIKEFPPEKLLDSIGKNMELSGLFTDTKA